MAGEYRIGLNGKAYYGAAGAVASNLMTNIQDVELNLTATKASTNSRSSVNFGSSKVVLLESTITFKLLNKQGDAAVAAIKAAFLAKTALAFYFMDATDGDGLDADFSITEFKRGEPLLEVGTFDVTIEPNNEIREPAWA